VINNTAKVRRDFITSKYYISKMDSEYIKGRGSQINTNNRFSKYNYVQEHIEGLDEQWDLNHETELIYANPKTIVNKVESPDIPGMYSMNPYQGCEHGCIYCYARNAHEYWGYSAGMDFEKKIIVKMNAPKLLEEQFMKKTWQPSPIMLSGNTDCYQPTERKLKITRGLLEVLLKFRNPVGIITKNSLILRDLDLISELAKLRLVHVMVSITSLDNDLRLKMEPRTTTAKQRLKIIKDLSDAGVPVGVMTAPIIPGINSSEIPSIIEQVALNGGTSAGMTIVRLNGAIGDIFHDWLNKTFPDRAEKVWNQICECHGGSVNDSRFGTRMRGEGKIAESIKQLHRWAVKKYMPKKDKFEYDLSAFKRPAKEGQMDLFD
jgi:DNA repair photolyase